MDSSALVLRADSDDEDALVASEAASSYLPLEEDELDVDDEDGEDRNVRGASAVVDDAAAAAAVHTSGVVDRHRDTATNSHDLLERTLPPLAGSGSGKQQQQQQQQQQRLHSAAVGSMQSMGADGPLSELSSSSMSSMLDDASVGSATHDSAIHSMQQSSVPATATATGQQRRFCGCCDGRAWRVMWHRCGLQFKGAEAEAEYRRRNLNTVRYYKYFIVGGLVFFVAKLGLAVGFISGMPPSRATANAGDYAFAFALLVVISIAVANACNGAATRHLWSWTVPIFLVAQAIDFATKVYDFTSPGFYDALYADATLGITNACSKVNIANGTFMYPTLQPGQSPPSCGQLNSTFCSVTEVLGVAGFITGIGEIAQLNQNWEYAVIIVALAAPVAEVVWLLPLPFLTVAAKGILLYFPPAGVGSMLFRPDITDKVFDCFPVWLLAYVSFLVQLLVMALFTFVFMAGSMCESERKTRRLFRIELKLKTKKRALLEQINPFSPRHLQEWMKHGQGQTLSERDSTSADSTNNNDDRAMNDPGNIAQASGWHQPDTADGQEWQLQRKHLKLVRRVAAGSAGIVWQGYYKRNLVAAKQLYSQIDPMLGGFDELAREAQMLGQLHHRYILPFLGLCATGGPSSNDAEDEVQEPYSLVLVTPWCPVTLRKWIDDDPDCMRPVIERLSKANQLACGLRYLQSRGVLHLDLKPDNVMISAAGNIQIADFGLSVHNVHLDNGGGASCDRTGTPGYMAPELFSPEELKKKFLSASRTASGGNKSQAQNLLASPTDTLRRRVEAAVTPRELGGHTGDRFASLLFQKVDVFSFAVVLWELFSGRSVPVLLRGQNAWSVIRRHAVDRQRPNLVLLSENTPEAMSALIKECWKHAAEDRPSFLDIYPRTKQMYVVEAQNEQRRRALNEEGQSQRRRLAKATKVSVPKGIGGSLSKFIKGSQQRSSRRGRFSRGSSIPSLQSVEMSEASFSSLGSLSSAKSGSDCDLSPSLQALPTPHIGDSGTQPLLPNSLLSPLPGSAEPTPSSLGQSELSKSSAQLIASPAHEDMGSHRNDAAETFVSSPEVFARVTCAVRWRAFWVTRTLLFPDAGYESAFLRWHFQNSLYFTVVRSIMFATFGSFVVIAAVVLILDTAAFNSGSSFATLKLAFNLALGSTEAENPAAVVFMNMADIWPVVLILVVGVLACIPSCRRPRRWRYLAWLAVAEQALRLTSYFVVFGTPASELSRPFAPNPNAGSMQNDSRIPSCNSSFYNSTFTEPQLLGCGSDGDDHFGAVKNPFVSFCSMASFSFTAGAFYGSFDAFHVQIWIVLYPVLMLLFALPFRFYVFTLVLPLVTAFVVLGDSAGPFSSPYFQLVKDAAFASDVLCAYAVSSNDTQKFLVASARSNLSRFCITIIIFYIVVPVHAGISEYRARVLFHIQNLLRKENRLLEQTPTWKPVASPRQNMGSKLLVKAHTSVSTIGYEESPGVRTSTVVKHVRRRLKPDSLFDWWNRSITELARHGQERRASVGGSEFEAAAQREHSPVCSLYLSRRLAPPTSAAATVKGWQSWRGEIVASQAEHDAEAPSSHVRGKTLPWEDVFLDHHELHRLLVARGKMQHRNIVAFWGISAATVAPKHPVANGSGSHVSASSSAASSLESDGLAPIPHTASWRGEDAVTARRFSRATEVNASQARHSGVREHALVWEWCDYNLYEFLTYSLNRHATQKFEVLDLVSIVDGIIRGLAHLKTVHKIAHCNLVPENVLICLNSSSSGALKPGKRITAKLVDFFFPAAFYGGTGAPTPSERGQRQVSRGNDIVACDFQEQLSYLAPEKLVGTVDTSAWASDGFNNTVAPPAAEPVGSDCIFAQNIFSLGVLIWQVFVSTPTARPYATALQGTSNTPTPSKSPEAASSPSGATVVEGAASSHGPPVPQTVVPTRAQWASLVERIVGKDTQLRPSLGVLNDDCPAFMLAIMQDCWAAEPSQRPTIAELEARRMQQKLSRHSSGQHADSKHEITSPSAVADC